MINNLIEYQNEIAEESEAKIDQENEGLWKYWILLSSKIGVLLYMLFIYLYINLYIFNINRNFNY